VPEGDTIYRAARTLHRALAGHVVVRFDTAFAHLAVVHENTPVTGGVGARLLSFRSVDGREAAGVLAAYAA